MLVWFVLLLMSFAIIYNILGLIYKSPALLVLSLLFSVFLVYAGGFYTVDVVSNGAILQFKERELMWFFGSAMTLIDAVFAFIFATTDLAKTAAEVERRVRT